MYYIVQSVHFETSYYIVFTFNKLTENGLDWKLGDDKNV